MAPLALGEPEITPGPQKNYERHWAARRRCRCTSSRSATERFAVQGDAFASKSFCRANQLQIARSNPAASICCKVMRKQFSDGALDRRHIAEPPRAERGGKSPTDFQRGTTAAGGSSLRSHHQLRCRGPRHRAGRRTIHDRGLLYNHVEGHSRIHLLNPRLRREAV